MRTGEVGWDSRPAAGPAGSTDEPLPTRGGRRAAPAPGRRGSPGPSRVLVCAVASLLVAATASLGVLVSEPVREVVPARSALVDAASAALSPGELESQRVSALTELLAARADALLARDLQGWMAPLAAGAYADRQRAVFDNLAAVPLESWRWEYAGQGAALGAERVAALATAAPVDAALAGAAPAGAAAVGAAPASQAAPAPAPAPEGAAGAWVAHVVLVYQLRDGGGEVRREQHLTLVPDTRPGAAAEDGGPAWLVADDTDGRSAVDLWDLGPVQVARGARCLVVGTGDVRPYVQVADEAARHVDEVWGEDWPRVSLIEVPASQAELARLLGRADEDGLEQIAAVTTGETAGDVVATTGDRVVVNPAGFASLNPQGRHMVLAHELTHVATRASTDAEVPIWLGEGYADWVGYRGSGLSRRTVASPLVQAVREGTAPTALATAEDFDPTLGDVAQAYAGSWLVVDMLAQLHGEEAVTAFYRAVASAGPVEAELARSGPVASADERAAERLDAALRAHFGIDEPALVRAWRERMTELAADDAGSPEEPGSGEEPGQLERVG